MKTLKLFMVVLIIAFFSCGNTSGQVWHVNVVVSFYDYDLTPYCPDCYAIGRMTGTWTYKYTIKLSEYNKIESIHWVIQDCDMHNQNGDKIICIDTGHDNFGVVWDFFNNPDSYNGVNSGVEYSTDEGWLDNYLPAVMPVEGTFVGLAFKTLIKGKRYDSLAAMAQLHINANGVITANVVKP